MFVDCCLSLLGVESALVRHSVTFAFGSCAVLLPVEALAPVMDVIKAPTEELENSEEELSENEWSFGSDEGEDGESKEEESSSSSSSSDDEEEEEEKEKKSGEEENSDLDDEAMFAMDRCVSFVSPLSLTGSVLLRPSSACNASASSEPSVSETSVSAAWTWWRSMPRTVRTFTSSSSRQSSCFCKLSRIARDTRSSRSLQPLLFWAIFLCFIPSFLTLCTEACPAG